MAEAGGRTLRRVTAGLLGTLLMLGAVVSTGGPFTAVLDILVAGLGGGYLIVMLLGAGVGALGVFVLVDNRERVEARELHDVERPAPAPVPGEPFDAQIRRWRNSLPVVGEPTQAAVRERLRAAAIRAVRADRGVTESRARAAVETGAWTDDPVAGRFLAGEPDQPTVAEWLRALRTATPPLCRRARRTIAVIVDREELSRATP